MSKSSGGTNPALGIARIFVFATDHCVNNANRTAQMATIHSSCSSDIVSGFGDEGSGCNLLVTGCNDCDDGQEESPCEGVFVDELQALTTNGLLFSVGNMRALDMAEPEKAQDADVYERVFIFTLVWSVGIVLRKADRLRLDEHVKALSVAGKSKPPSFRKWHVGQARGVLRDARRLQLAVRGEQAQEDQVQEGVHGLWTSRLSHHADAAHAEPRARPEPQAPAAQDHGRLGHARHRVRRTRLVACAR